MIAGQADTYSAAMVRFRDEALRQLPQGVRLNEQIMDQPGKMGRADGPRVIPCR